ncbi:hypothetical protein AB0J81_36000 [Streptomyces bobili]|uniref:hypothetical protein n=1 Tax=Streptomyces bobili TaxID=67280 RepID=UPI00341CEAF9
MKTYVVMIGTLPTAAASTLEAAQANAFEAEKPYISEGAEIRWDEHRPGSAWRLMTRPKGRRFAWTQRWVAAVPTADA